MKKKDVLFLCQYFYPEYVSSATLPYDTAKAISNAGYKVGALCGYPKEYMDSCSVPKREIVDGIDIKRMRYVEVDRNKKIGRLVNYFSFLISSFFHLFELSKYRLVFVYSNPPLLSIVASIAKKLFGTRFIFVAYDLYPEIAVETGTISDSSLAAKTMRFINHQVFKTANGVVALSRDMKNFISSSRHFNPKRIAVIPNWYEDVSDIFSILKDNDFTKQFKNKFVVSYLGNMGTCQDMDTIMDSVVKLSGYEDIVFLLAGHGNKVSQIKSYVKEKQLNNVIIYDFLHGDDYYNALRVSDCSILSLKLGITSFCSPSKAYGYMMAGNAIIAVMDECDITREIDNCEYGFSVRNGDSKSLADGILNLYNDRNLLETMKLNSLNTFKKKYTMPICTDKYVKIVSHILSDER